MNEPRVLVLHNRYRTAGGEERAVELQLAALERAGVPAQLLERRSDSVGALRAAKALLRGGEHEREVGAAVSGHRAAIAHVHNTLPLIGVRGLQAARRAGARVVLQLHNVRLFCATGFGERDGVPCTSCRGRNTLPGLTHNCRGSLAQAAVYAPALSIHQPRTFAAVDVFLTPSRWSARRLGELGLPADRVEVLPHYLPDEAFAPRSEARHGEYALVAARLSPEKGIDDAIAAAGAAGVPLRIAGAGPDKPRLEGLARASDGPVEFLGLLEPVAVREQLRGAAAVLMPSRYEEFFGYSALEAMAQGVPVVATRLGGLADVVGPERCIPLGDRSGLAGRLAGLWGDAGLRESEGEAQLTRVRTDNGESTYVKALTALYRRLVASA